MKYLSIALLIVLVSCSGPQVSQSEAAPQGAFAAEKMSRSDMAPQAEPSVEPSAAYESTKQIKTGNLVIEASDLDAAEAAITAKLKTAGGFVENSVTTPSSRSLTLRLPSAAFDAFVGGMTTLGKVVQRNVTVADVTVQFYDLETRIKNQRLLLDQYRGFLSQTKKMDEILDAMARISDLTTQIESTEGQFRYLSRQVVYSTLTVELTSPLLSAGRSWPDWDRGMSEVIHNIADFAVGTLFFLITSLVVVPVLAALVALVVWLLLGKPALWRRLSELRARPKPGFKE